MLDLFPHRFDGFKHSFEDSDSWLRTRFPSRNGEIIITLTICAKSQRQSVALACLCEKSNNRSLSGGPSEFRPKRFESMNSGHAVNQVLFPSFFFLR
jgi:hypothetical protein